MIRLIHLFADKQDVVRIMLKTDFFEYEYVNPLHKNKDLLSDTHNIVESIFRQVDSEKEYLGTIEITYTQKVITNKIRNFIVMGFIIIASIIGIISGSTIFLLNKIFNVPFTFLITGINKIAGGDYAYLSNIESNIRISQEFKPLLSSRRHAPAGGRHRTGVVDQPRVGSVDDDPNSRSIVRRLMEPLDFEVAEAENGQEGVDVARRLRPDVMLMDMRMPVMTGLEAVSRIRRIDELRDVVIVGFSANLFDSDKHESLRAGCDSFISKPLAVEELFAVMHSCLKVEWVYAEVDKDDLSAC